MRAHGSSHHPAQHSNTFYAFLDQSAYERSIGINESLPAAILLLLSYHSAIIDTINTRRCRFAGYKRNEKREIDGRRQWQHKENENSLLIVRCVRVQRPEVVV